MCRYSVIHGCKCSCFFGVPKSLDAAETTKYFLSDCEAPVDKLWVFKFMYFKSKKTPLNFPLPISSSHEKPTSHNLTDDFSTVWKC